MNLAPCRYGFTPTHTERRAFAESVGSWPPFPDSAESLARLSARFRLVILSNVDDDLFAGSADALGNPFHMVITAEQIGSYKPSQANFRCLIEAVEGAPESLIHVAQSLFHDVKPAREARLRTVWINRRRDLGGSGATPPADAVPDLEFGSMKEFADFALGTPVSEWFSAGETI